MAQTAKQGMTLAQFVERGEAKFLAADANHDGRISAAEWQAARSDGDGGPARRFERMDRNHDGFVDRSEIDAALTRRFQNMDANGDGMLTPQERQAAHQRAAAKGA